MQRSSRSSVQASKAHVEFTARSSIAAVDPGIPRSRASITSGRFPLMAMRELDCFAVIAILKRPSSRRE